MSAEKIEQSVFLLKTLAKNKNVIITRWEDGAYVTTLIDDPSNGRNYKEPIFRMGIDGVIGVVCDGITELSYAPEPPKKIASTLDPITAIRNHLDCVLQEQT